MTPLHRAVFDGNSIETARLLREGNVPVDSQDHPERFTPLHCAAINGQLAVAQLLVNAGADINFRAGCYDMETPLRRAIDERRLKVASMLIGQGADPNIETPDGLTCLHAAIYGTRRIDIEFIRVLLQHGANVNAGNGIGKGCLHSAIYMRRHDVVELLLQNGAALEYQRNGFGEVPLLHYAVNTGQPEIAELLLNHGCNINAYNNLGDTALHEASSGLCIGNIVSYRGREPQGAGVFSDAQAREINLQMLKLLIDRNADVNWMNVFGDTPLVVAIQTRYKEAIQYLLNHGADLNNNGVLSKEQWLRYKQDPVTNADNGFLEKVEETQRSDCQSKRNALDMATVLADPDICAILREHANVHP